MPVECDLDMAGFMHAKRVKSGALRMPGTNLARNE
jgi:hypothetical protein